MRNTRLLIASLSVSLLLLSCASAKPGPDVFNAAERAIEAAERAGAEELAPVELRFAREKLESARRGMAQKQYEVALYRFMLWPGAVAGGLCRGAEERPGAGAGARTARITESR